MKISRYKDEFLAEISKIVMFDSMRMSYSQTHIPKVELMRISFGHESQTDL